MIDARRAIAACFVLALVTVTSCRTRSGTSDLDAGPLALDAGSLAPDAGPLDLDAGGARTCDASSAACAAGEYCAFTPGLCGKGKRPGACRPRPTDCHDARAPVCGCDGKAHESECEARAAGIDLDANGGCRERIPGWIACGPRYCDAHTSYCEIVLSDVFELPTDYTCKPLPAACVPEGEVARSCDCFPAGTRCLSFCGYIPSGGLKGFHLTCRL